MFLNFVKRKGHSSRNVRAQAEGRRQLLCFPRAIYREIYCVGPLSQFIQFNLCSLRRDLTNQAHIAFPQHCCMLKTLQKSSEFPQSSSLFLDSVLQIFLLLAFKNDFQDVGEIHHLGEHFHDVGMILGSTDELLQCQLT